MLQEHINHRLDFRYLKNKYHTEHISFSHLHRSWIVFTYHPNKFFMIHRNYKTFRFDFDMMSNELTEICKYADILMTFVESINTEIERGYSK